MSKWIKMENICKLSGSNRRRNERGNEICSFSGREKTCRNLRTNSQEPAALTIFISRERM